MQLRNGKTTGPKVIKCCCQRARKSVPHAKSCVSNNTHDSFSMIELKGMITEFALKYETPFQRANGLCEIYDYLLKHVAYIRGLGDALLLNNMRKRTLILIRDSAANAARYPADAELQKTVWKLIPKLVLFIENTN